MLSAISLELPLASSDLRSDLLWRRTDTAVLPIGSARIDWLRTWDAKIRPVFNFDTWREM
jgi:hypothetical protein